LTEYKKGTKYSSKKNHEQKKTISKGAGFIKSVTKSNEPQVNRTETQYVCNAMHSFTLQIDPSIRQRYSLNHTHLFL